LQIGLDWWLDRLEPVLQQFLETYEGRADNDWWGRVITNRAYGSGGGLDSISGWVRFFFPYTDGGDLATFEEEHLDASNLPRGYVECPFKLDEKGPVTDCQLLAGSFGVKITKDGGAAPCMGWLVRKAEGEVPAKGV
jgi:hypothetical protein